MQVEFSHAAQFQLRTLGDDDRQRVSDWCDRLKKWETDEDVRTRSRLLRVPEYRNVYLLPTSTDYRVFFTLYPDHIEVFDIAHKDTLQKFATAV